MIQIYMYRERYRDVIIKGTSPNNTDFISELLQLLKCFGSVTEYKLWFCQNLDVRPLRRWRCHLLQLWEQFGIWGAACLAPSCRGQSCPRTAPSQRQRTVGKGTRGLRSPSAILRVSFCCAMAIQTTDVSSKLFKMRSETNVLWVLVTQVPKEERNKGVKREAVWKRTAVLHSARLPRVVNQHVLLSTSLRPVLPLVPKPASLKRGFASLRGPCRLLLAAPRELEPSPAGFCAGRITGCARMGKGDTKASLAARRGAEGAGTTQRPVAADATRPDAAQASACTAGLRPLRLHPPLRSQGRSCPCPRARPPASAVMGPSLNRRLPGKLLTRCTGRLMASPLLQLSLLGLM